MDFFPWNGIKRPHRRGAMPSIRRPIFTKLRPACESMEDRRLFSTVAVLPAPSTTDVANAAAVLNALDPTTFAQFQSDLAHAESQSDVTPSQAHKLARDEKIIDQVVESAGLDANTRSTVLNQVQTDADNAFLETTLSASSWTQEQQALSQVLDQDVPSVHFSSFFIRDTINQMKVVARASRDAAPLNDAVTSDWAVLANDLSSTPDTNPAPGAAGLDALQVYYDSQVNNFIKR